MSARTSRAGPTRCVAIAGGLVAALAMVGTGTTSHAQPVYRHLRLIAPAAPGGGWDQTARAMQLALTEAGVVQTSSVENIPGAAGTIGLAKFVNAERGKGDVLMVSGLIMQAAVATHRSAVTLDDVTPIARLTGEFEVIVVPVASPFRTLADLLDAFKAHPESISWGGGSAGGTDQILAGLIADAIGVSPRKVNYIAFSGGGDSMAAITGGQVTVGVNGLAEFAAQIEAGTVRVLGVSSAERLTFLDAPTLREQGVDVVLENWRSLVAPPGISDADRQRLERAVDAMVKSQAWREALARYGWTDRHLAGAEFAAFVEREEERVQAILRQLGTGGAAATSLAAAGPYPLFVLAGLGVCTVLFVAGAVRAHRASTHVARGPGVAALSLIAAGIVLDLLLVDTGGFVIASTVLFWLTARAFDKRHPVRDACFALGVSVAAYLLFVRILDLSLPAGLLAGWM